MGTLGTLGIVIGILLLLIFILLIVWWATGGFNDSNSDQSDSNNEDNVDVTDDDIDNDDQSDTDTDTHDDTKSSCKIITNVLNNKYLNKIRIHLKGHYGSFLSPSATEGNGLCFLGNTSQPLSVVESDQEPDPNWAFDTFGYLHYTDKHIFTTYGLVGINDKYYLTYTKPKLDDNDNTIDAWYGIDDPKGEIYPASMTILPTNNSKGCHDQLCVTWHGAINGSMNGAMDGAMDGAMNGEYDYITTNINGKTYYLTANTLNSFVFWYSTNNDKRFHDRQLWSIQINEDNDNHPYDHKDHKETHCDNNSSSNNNSDSSDSSDSDSDHGHKRRRRRKYRKHKKHKPHYK